MRTVARHLVIYMACSLALGLLLYVLNGATTEFLIWLVLPGAVLLAVSGWPGGAFAVMMASGLVFGWLVYLPVAFGLWLRGRRSSPVVSPSL
jgi:hypothetical protein